MLNCEPARFARLSQHFLLGGSRKSHLEGLTLLLAQFEEEQSLLRIGEIAKLTQFNRILVGRSSRLEETKHRSKTYSLSDEVVEISVVLLRKTDEPSTAFVQIAVH